MRLPVQRMVEGNTFCFVEKDVRTRKRLGSSLGPLSALRLWTADSRREFSGIRKKKCLYFSVQKEGGHGHVLLCRKGHVRVFTGLSWFWEFLENERKHI